MCVANHSDQQEVCGNLGAVVTAPTRLSPSGVARSLERNCLFVLPIQSGPQIRGCPSFSGRLAFPSDPALFETLQLRAQRIPCDVDRMLFRQGDKPVGLYLICSGEVNGMVQSDDGRIVAVFHGDPGAVLGLPATSCNRPYSLSALARQGSDIGFVAKSDFELLVRDQPAIYMAVLRVLAAEVHAARQALASM